MARAIVAVSAPSFRPPSFRSAEMSAPRVCAGCGLADRHEYDDAGDRRRVALHGYDMLLSALALARESVPRKVGVPDQTGLPDF